MHALFLLQRTPQQIDVQQLNAGKPQGLSRMALTLAFWGGHVCECTRVPAHVVW